ncbi:hypothetical protein ACN28C_10510 [Plantactinospora sp. WMMC1484]|uniref:hypothetical protein n=1 Tax=Plantactinospora sp. WMMC1484 TaxID=3404122 RepID=UPI003BF543D2
MSAGGEPVPEAGSEAGRPLPPPLPWRDVVRLHLAGERLHLTGEHGGPPGWLIRYARWLAFFAGLALCLLLLIVAPATPCTAAAPCGPDPVGNLIFGMAGGIPLLALVRLEFAAAVTAAMVATTLGYELTQTEHLPPWFHVLLVAYAVGCLLLARLAGVGAYRSELRLWHGREGRSVPPPPARLPGPALVPAVAATTLLTAGLALTGWSVLRQAEVDEQQRRATIATATVRSHPSWSDVELDLGDGRPRFVVSVHSSAGYPVGSTIDVAVDDAGLRQLVSEPYDLTPWLALAAVLGLTGLGLGWRTGARMYAGRRFFRLPQPASTVDVHRGIDRVYVYAGTGPAVLPLAEIEVAEDLDPTVGRGRERAVLHGVPAPGQWPR